MNGDINEMLPCNFVVSLSLSLQKDHDACFILRMARMNLERTSVHSRVRSTSLQPIFFCCHLHKAR